jgi:hypothetical protein
MAIIITEETTRRVKNLGWLLSHRDEVIGFALFSDPEAQADGFLVAYTSAGTYITTFADFTIARQWLARPSLRFLPLIEANGTLSYCGEGFYKPKRGLTSDELKTISWAKKRFISGYDLLRYSTIEDTDLETWFERDRAHVELKDKRTDETIIEFWDEAVNEAVEDGFLNPRDYHTSCFEYADSLGLVRERLVDFDA